jgi:hypothetical protein
MSRTRFHPAAWQRSGAPDAEAPIASPDEAAFRAWHDTSDRVFLFPWPMPRAARSGRGGTREK